jgi:DNA-binding response OmpR family regulator
VRLKVKSNPVAEDNFPDGYVEISVSDTGPGIPDEQSAYVFDRFFQADSTYEYHQKGSGIGLALSKELVELHRGTIGVENREEGGSRFVVRLPPGRAHLEADEIVESGVLEESADAPMIVYDAFPSHETDENKQKFCGGPGDDFTKEPPGRRGQEKDIILVVEDSGDMRDYIRGALEHDYAVVEAGDGREGIEKARQIIPDLIISDIMMPEADGYELCRTLKKDVATSHVPVILLTAKASEENVIEGLETGADDYITKPFSTRILLARIRNLIDIRAQLQRNINREMTLQPVKTAVSGIDREFLRETHDVINKNISDENFNVEQLCKKLYMGRTTLYRKIMALSGLTPTEFIRSYRLKRGAELLKRNFGTVLEVALEVGFSNSSYFAKCFKEKFHRLPSEYHETNKE